jgi:hypothetical protein
MDERNAAGNYRQHFFLAGIGDKYQQFEGFLGLAEKPLIH